VPKKTAPQLLLFGLLFAASCATRPPGLFQVLPAEPTYVLRSPAPEDTPFPQVLSRYTHLDLQWVDLKAEMGLRVENAYFREGAPKHTLTDFIGTEVAQYQVQKTGELKLVSLESKVAQPPKDQPPVQGLMSASSARRPYHRFFYQIAFLSRGESRNAVLLSSRSASELGELGAQLLTKPDSVCGDRSANCTIFPEACTVSVEMQIVVNGVPQTVLWGSSLESVAENARRIQMLRPYAGRLVPVQIDPSDPRALRLPLLPGDRINSE